MWIRISQPSGDCTTTCQQPCSTRNPLFISNSFWPTQSPPGLGGRRVVTKPLNGTEAGSGRSASQWRGIRHSPPPATKIPEEPKVKPAHLWLDLFDHCAAASSSPGGKEENTGAASKLSDRLTMGSVEVTSSDPVKLLRSNRVGIFILRTMPVGRQHQIFASQHLPIRVPGSKGNQSRCVGRVGIGRRFTKRWSSVASTTCFAFRVGYPDGIRTRVRRGGLGPALRPVRRRLRRSDGFPFKKRDIMRGSGRPGR